MMGGYSMMGGMDGSMLLIAIFWSAIAALIFWGFFRTSCIQRRVLDSAPQEILKQRYARGEISREEFEQIREALSKHRAGARTL